MSRIDVFQPELSHMEYTYTLQQHGEISRHTNTAGKNVQTETLPPGVIIDNTDVGLGLRT